MKKEFSTVILSEEEYSRLVKDLETAKREVKFGKGLIYMLARENMDLREELGYVVDLDDARTKAWIKSEEEADRTPRCCPICGEPRMLNYWYGFWGNDHVLSCEECSKTDHEEDLSKSDTWKQVQHELSISCPEE